MSDTVNSPNRLPLMLYGISRRQVAAPRLLHVLLVGPYDPTCGEFTFLSPPLGVWRLAGRLDDEGCSVEVFDPNCCDGSPEVALHDALRRKKWDVVGFSTTGMTLRFDLGLAHLARSVSPASIIIAGGMEATFNSAQVLALAPLDFVVLGEGERPMKEALERLRVGATLEGIAGTAAVSNGGVVRIPQRALTRDELRDSIFRTPYERMPYRQYWDKLERAYRVGDLSVKGERETRLAEIRSVRLITLNYCPMGCTFCASTNFLNAAQDSTARIARLDAEECLEMVTRVVNIYPDVRTVIFQDDIFVFTSDHRITPLCEGIIAAKAAGVLPRELQFISTNRIDAMNSDRFAVMRRAGFRVLGFGVENFSLPVLKEFNKAQIFPFIEPGLAGALAHGITPFLDMILTSPGCRLEDLAFTIRQAYRWTLAGCETGMYPYVIPFSGAAMAVDPALKQHTVSTRYRIAGTEIEWEQPTKILPSDERVRNAILSIEEEFLGAIENLEAGFAHLPSRVRSLVWVMCAVPVLTAAGFEMPAQEEIRGHLAQRLPKPRTWDVRQEVAAVAML
jgi:radical SAM superfamily enzyme YgiQ (UPF0313 family)